ncbi:MBL fold metallo-hydrolase [Thalassomonas sp. M1454]|uniref:MBL fold metallo-hydrolase n=1 Tax=Thalassomonas sp. M1454 TaxID=2594477 RepID=UPI00117F4D60|nr:MBL fold metallo-hydrolase [Thalassomonas sp. M1454]TRX57006.1 MBL fold metallo-hydrolase [Thalassomonas sp. M1454]
MSLQIQHFFHPASFTISYVVYDDETKQCAVIDPALDYDPIASSVNTAFAQEIISFIKDKQLSLIYILETHAHADHISSAFYLKKKLGGDICIGRNIVGIQKTFKTVFNLAKDFNTQGVQFDQLLNDGDVLTLGNFAIEVISTPGHTPDSVTYLIEGNAFIGDTLFMYDSGSARCDFPGGDASLLYSSIQRLYALPDNTNLYMCHDYQPAGRELMFVTTVAEQKQKNIQIKADTSEQEYVTKREARDSTLANPKLIFPALQCNIQAGDLPAADNDEKHYFKTPISGLENLE